MKTASLTVLLVGLLSSGVAMGQGPSPQDADHPGSPDNQVRRMEMRRHQPGMNVHRGNMQFGQERRAMQPEQRPAEMDRPGQDFKPPAAAAPPACRHAHCCHGAKFLLIFCGIIHILLTVWVYQDIRKRNAGSGIWIVVTLMTGLLGAAVYALVRLGDKSS